MILPDFGGCFSVRDSSCMNISDFVIFDELFVNSIYFNPFCRYNVCYNNRR